MGYGTTLLLSAVGLGWLLPLFWVTRTFIGLLLLPLTLFALPILVPIWIAKTAFSVFLTGLKVLFLPIFFPYKLMQWGLSIITFGII